MNNLTDSFGVAFLEKRGDIDTREEYCSVPTGDCEPSVSLLCEMLAQAVIVLARARAHTHTHTHTHPSPGSYLKWSKVIEQYFQQFPRVQSTVPLPSSGDDKVSNSHENSKCPYLNLLGIVKRETGP